VVSFVPCFYVEGVDGRWKRLLRQSLQVPFELAAGVGLAGVLTMIFAVEVFMSEVYSGPFKQYLVPSSFEWLLTGQGVYPDGPLFDFDSNVFGNLYANLKDVDEL
jgi:hypothetical protein